MMTSNRYDVIIVGAGISGLTTAYNIKKRCPGASIMILEANDRVGGRTVTVPMVAASGSDMWDLGGQWVGKSQVHVMKLIEELGLETYRQYTEGKAAMQIDGAKVTFYKGTIPKLPFLSLLDLGWTMFRYDCLQKQVDVHDPFSHPKAEEWDAISVKHHLDKTMYTKAGRDSMDASIRVVFGMEANQMSFLFYLMYVHQAVDLSTLLEDKEGTAQESKIKGGAQRISLELLSRIGSENLRLKEPVQSISQTDSGVTVVTANGWKGVASRAVLAMPPQLIQRIEFNPPMPRDRVDFTKHFPMGNYIKVIVTYEKPFWRINGHSGIGVSFGHPLSDDGVSAPLCIVADATSCNNNPALVGFIGGKMAVEWARKSASERKKGVLAHLASIHGPEAESCLDYAEKDWNLEPFSLGGPVSCLSVGAMEDFSRAIRRVEGRIHFAGTDTATSWTGYMSGAIQAGERAALEVLSHTQPETLSDQDRLLLKEGEDARRRLSQREKAKKSRSWWSKISAFLGVTVLSVSVAFVAFYANY